ncbi:MAG: winged helix-turn-helix domain-containing protein [Sphingomonadaceae bacterium]|nr:winged helix-turn-helix domain-containing protein [Sphingomonadaceae bacterium]
MSCMFDRMRVRHMCMLCGDVKKAAAARQGYICLDCICGGDVGQIGRGHAGRGRKERGVSGRRWLKFWPQDWQRDPALRSCCVAARGIWIDLICIAHEGTPYGHLTINGKPITTRQIGTITGAGEREAAKLMQELEDAGVFSRTDDGVIYSRRMVRDYEAAQAGREAIAKRWENAEKDTSPPDSTPNRGGDSLEAEAERKKDTEASLLPHNPSERGDIRDELWQRGLPILRRLSGIPDAKARALLGRLLKSARDDCARVLAALDEAQDMRPVDPVSWLTRAVVAQRVSVDDRIRMLIEAEPEPLPQWMLQ